MANLLVLNGSLAQMYLKESGQGTDLDPHIPYVHVADGMLSITGSVSVGSMPSLTMISGSVSVYSMPSITLTSNSGTNIGAVTLLDGESHAGEFGGRTVVEGDETTMLYPANAHAAGDAVAGTTSNTGTAVLRGIPVARVNGGSGYITKLKMWTDQAACTARFRVHFYTVEAPTGAIVGDDAAMTLLYVNKAQELGHIDLPAMASAAAGSSGAQAACYWVRLPFVCAGGDKKIYYRYETLDDFTPDAAQKYYLEVGVEQN